MSAGRARCGHCGRSRPEDETVLIAGHAQGSYRRAGRWTRKRVCRDCTISRVDYVRGEQQRQMSVGLNEHAYSWEQATRYFGLDITGLVVDRLTGRTA